MLERHTVESSMLIAVNYDPDYEIMDLEFHSGELIRYFDIPACIVDSLLTAESKGKFYNFLIKGAFESQRLRDIGGRRSFNSPRKLQVA